MEVSAYIPPAGLEAKCNGFALQNAPDVIHALVDAPYVDATSQGVVASTELGVWSPVSDKTMGCHVVARCRMDGGNVSSS